MAYRDPNETACGVGPAIEPQLLCREIVTTASQLVDTHLCLK